MEYKEFFEYLSKYSEKIEVDITEKESKYLFNYMKLLLEWNNRINLTAITNEKEIILKHFIDSLTTNKYIKNNKTIMDIGTGAGFPGIPLKILNEEINFILVDSLNKRINFLQEVKNRLEINKLDLIHSRVEDLAHNVNYREKSDIVISRAVANLRVLVEYMLPLVRKKGYCICMKGPKIDEELKDSKKAIEILGGKIEKIDKITLPQNLERNILIIKKVENTPSKYPRKAGIPAKQPL